MASQDTNRNPGLPEGPAVMAVQTVGSTCPETPAPRAVVFDLEGMHVTSVGGLSWLLTAQQVAETSGGMVWVRNAPPRTWALFRALGMDELFLPYPEPTADSN